LTLIKGLTRRITNNFMLSCKNRLLRQNGLYTRALAIEWDNITPQFEYQIVLHENISSMIRFNRHLNWY